MYLELEVLRDALIFYARAYGLSLPYDAKSTHGEWNDLAIRNTLEFIDYARLTGQFISKEVIS